MLAFESPCPDERKAKSRRPTDPGGYCRGVPTANWHRPDRSIRPYNPAEFIHDLIVELSRRSCPRYPTREWKLALEIANEADIRRLVVARQAEADGEYFARQKVFELPEWTDLRVHPQAAWGHRFRRA